MHSPVDLIPAILKEEEAHPPALAFMDFGGLNRQEVSWLLQQHIISLPVLVRNLIALRQNGIEKVFCHYRAEQKEIRDFLAGQPLVSTHLSWIDLEGNGKVDAKVLQPLCQKGCLWVNPFFLMNGIFLRGFFQSMNGSHLSQQEIICNPLSKHSVLWLSPLLFQENRLHLESPLSGQFKALPHKEIAIDDPEVEGQLIRRKSDIGKAEKILFSDVTRKKGGYLAKIFNEPISLWIAKHCAKTSLQPNIVTLLNTVLGLFSAYLVLYGTQAGLYWPLLWGGVLFYLVDIFDGIDGELARFTFRLDKNGALYDTISDNIILISFLGASTFAAYMQVSHWLVIASGIFTVGTALLAVMYLYYFTMKHFGNASLRLYEAKFMPKIPRDNKFVRFVFSMRNLYTKDILAALLTFAMIINQPILITIFAPLLMMILFFGFFYMGSRYSYLLASMEPSKV